MFAKQLVQLSTKRAFSASTRVSGAHFKEGVYNNIPVKVHGRKIPYAIIHFGFFSMSTKSRIVLKY